MTFLNLGIVAHVDAGKTSLTERLLHAGGVIDRIGSVDAGSTQTDTLELERRRGITIKSAVASFPIGGVTVNLIDTPGHPDFIAEVERALRVLDGAVLVVSAVEGVQAHTRLLMRTLRRMRVPTLLFVNKIDRRGAREADLLRDLAARLVPDIVPMAAVAGLGGPDASARPLGAADPGHVGRLVEVAGDDTLLSAYVRRESSVPYARLRAALAERTAAAEATPVFFGSALTGAGVGTLMAAMTELLPVATGDPAGPASGLVFKVDRGVAYVRMFSGTVRVRDRMPDGSTVTAVEGAAGDRRSAVSAGEIAKLHGLRVRIGDAIGRPPETDGTPLFAPPTLETVVVPKDPADGQALHAALAGLAEQDPLINLRADGTVSLYGEVQKEVIEATLADDYGLAASFRESSTIHVERPVREGRAGATLGEDGNPYLATVDLRVEPGPAGSGVAFALDVPIEQVPIYLFKTRERFRDLLADAVRHALERGPYGWQVIDVRITATRTGYAAPMTQSGDYRKLVPLVLMDALRAAGTVVCEPIQRFTVDGPADLLGAMMGALGRFGAVPHTQEVSGETYVITGVVPAARVRELETALPRLTHGEGLLECAFDHYRPMPGRRIRRFTNPSGAFKAPL